MSDISTPSSDEQIAQLALHFWEEKGKPEGKAEVHWAKAEAELRVRLLESLAIQSGTAVPPVTVGVS